MNKPVKLLLSLLALGAAAAPLLAVTKTLADDATLEYKNDVTHTTQTVVVTNLGVDSRLSVTVKDADGIPVSKPLALIGVPDSTSPISLPDGWSICVQDVNAQGGNPDSNSNPAVVDLDIQ